MNHRNMLQLKDLRRLNRRKALRESNESNRPKRGGLGGGWSVNHGCESRLPSTAALALGLDYPDAHNVLAAEDAGGPGLADDGAGDPRADRMSRLVDPVEVVEAAD